jgi:V/A-type H+-transporting ATPase subunit E
METNKIRKAILDKAKADADKIISDAEIKAKETIEKAEVQKEQKFEGEKKKIISEARREASKILAQASLKSRQEILKEKDAVINEVIKKAKDELSQDIKDKELFIHLIKETLEALEGEDTVRLFVSSRDLEIVREVVAENSELKEKIAEVKNIDCIGGIMIETINGMVSIDNTFDTRLEMLMPKILPEIGKNLFGVGEN